MAETPREKSPQEWTEEVLARMHMELDCCKNHLDQQDFQSIVMHMTNIAYGCQVTAEMICDKILTHEQIVELLRGKLEETLGTPIEYVQSVDGWEQFRSVPIDVPDDARELTDE
jgi:hypothetical protein